MNTNTLVVVYGSSDVPYQTRVVTIRETPLSLVALANKTDPGRKGWLRGLVGSKDAKPISMHAVSDEQRVVEIYDLAGVDGGN